MKRTVTNQAFWKVAAGLVAALWWTTVSPADAKGQEIRTQSEKPAGKAVEADGGNNADAVAAAMANCEHEVPIYQCAECRYEAGVSKADDSLWKNEKGGLLVAQAVTNRKVRAVLSLTGEVRLNENTAVHLSPRVAGVIESVGVDIGSTVKAGDELFAINSMEFGKALSDYERSLALTALSEKNYEREKTLVTQKASSEQDLNEAQMTYEQHRADLKTAEQTLYVIGLTENDMATLKAGVPASSVGRLTTRAPLNGTIVEKHAAIGELAEPGRDVMLVADLTTVWVWANVHERDLSALVKARESGPIPVSVIVNAYPGRMFSGQIDYIGVTVDEQTRTVKVRATVANADLALRPGMFCDVRAAIGAEEEALTLPRAAVLSDAGLDFVFVHWKDDYYMRRNITRGRDFVEEIEVCGGLKSGERVVVEGAFLMKSDVLREKMGAGCAD